MKPSLTVTMLPVAHGDAIWVEYVGDDDRAHRILIDAGPASTYVAVQQWFADRASAERALDLFVITHIDADHIDGAILLLRDMKALGVTFEDVWFNGWRHLQEDEIVNETYGALQGEFLGALLLRDALPWNRAFDGRAVVVPDHGLLPTKSLPGGPVLTLLSPYGRQLRRLRRNWETVGCDAGWQPGDEGRALDRLQGRKDYVPPTPVDVFGSDNRATDNSVANGSSIAFVIEHKGLCCLFTGDALAPVLTDSLIRFASLRSQPVKFDLVKVAHHGSKANIDEELRAYLPSKRFLISTNGDKFHHPDAATIELLVGDSASRPEIWFNYRSDFTEPWADVGRQARFGYQALFPAVDKTGVTVELEAT